MVSRSIVVVIAVVACHPIPVGAESLTLAQVQTTLETSNPRQQPTQACDGRVVRNEVAEAVFKGYLANGPAIEHGSSRSPFYSVLFDTIVLPEPGLSCTVRMYYHRLFHELGHSTAASHRLDRNLTRVDEEVVAELTAILLLRQADLDIDYSHARSILDAFQVSETDLARLWPQAVRAATYIASGRKRSPVITRIPPETAY